MLCFVLSSRSGLKTCNTDPIPATDKDGAPLKGLLCVGGCAVNVYIRM
jgi:hypothetical protein